MSAVYTLTWRAAIGKMGTSGFLLMSRTVVLVTDKYVLATLVAKVMSCLILFTSLLLRRMIMTGPFRL